MLKLKYNLIPNSVLLTSKKRKMPEKLLCKLKMKNPLELFMLKIAFILIIILEKINIWLTKKPDLDKRDLKTKIIWWIIWWTLLEEEIWDKCQWIWWWCILSCQWCNLWWEVETMEVCPWEVIWEIEEEWEIEVDNKVLLKVECNKDLKETWWIIWICNNHKWVHKELKLLLVNNNPNNKLNLLLFNNLKIIHLNLLNWKLINKEWFWVKCCSHWSKN